MVVRPKGLGLVTMPEPHLGQKNFKFFKNMIGLQKQALPYLSRIFHSYAVELNCKLFFVCATYFINLLYPKRKE